MVAFWILAPIMVAGRARHPVRPQGRARGAAAGGRDDRPGGAVRRAGRAVPVRGADHRLHRRDPDAVPVRADARRRRRVRLGGGDDQGPAARWPRSSAWSSASLLVLGVGQVVPRRGRSGWPTANADGNVPGLAQLLFARYVFAFEATSALLITAAIGAMVLAHRERLDPEADPGRPGRAADARLRRARQAPRPAAAARRLRPPQRRGHPGAAARRHRRRRSRSPGCSQSRGTVRTVPRSPRTSASSTGTARPRARPRPPARTRERRA